MVLPEVFLEYSKLFSARGFALFLVGGTSRDLLLGLTPSDLDFATDATPEEMSSFLSDLDLHFAKFGSVKAKKTHIDITTFREEGNYQDYRHPSSLRFVGDPKTDSFRRDFTVNALYIDDKQNVLDFHGGRLDLERKLIRFIGDPAKRIQEDPLRILRAERFARRLGFAIEASLQKAIEENRYLLKKLNPEKVKMEKEKE